MQLTVTYRSRTLPTTTKEGLAEASPVKLLVAEEGLAVAEAGSGLIKNLLALLDERAWIVVDLMSRRKRNNVSALPTM